MGLDQLDQLRRARVIRDGARRLRWREVGEVGEVVCLASVQEQ